MTRARNWKAALGLPNADIHGVYSHAICKLAASKAEQEALTDEREFKRPNLSKASDIVKNYDPKKPPDWWPSGPIIMTIQVHSQAEGCEVQHFYPQLFPPSPHDLGVSQMTRILMHIGRTIGTPFTGHICIHFIDSDSQSWLTGWDGDLEVGVRYNKRIKKNTGPDEGQNPGLERS